MKIIDTGIEGLVVFEPRVFEDERGYFFESFNAARFNELIGKEVHFVQDNESLSHKGVLRGLHFQHPPHAQGKLVRVAAGSVWDVAVDLRKGSSTYGKHFGVELSVSNRLQMWIPEGFAHGFLALEDQTRFLYKCTNYYAPQSEGTLLWNDPDFNISWHNENPIVSSKDSEGERFVNFNSPF